MKQHIDTIPVLEAYEKNTECPLCYLEQTCEEKYLDSFLGGSVMEPESRAEVNKKGFCKKHFNRLFHHKNRLGLGLLTHTYSKELINELEQILQDSNNSLDKLISSSLINGLNNHVTGKFNAITTVAGKIDKTTERHITDCVFCERMEKTMDRYVYTILYLWKKEEEFKAALEDSKGFCMSHLNMVIQCLSKNFKTRQSALLLKSILALQLKNMKRIEKDLEWFLKKFDYKNADKPWGDSKDSLERMINKIEGSY